eukprot:s1_g484.t1
MGRLVGIGSALAVIAVAGLFLGFGAYFVQDNAGDAPEGTLQASAEAGSLSVDPACFWPVLDSAFSPDAAAAPTRVLLRGCAPADAEAEIEGDWTRVSLQSGWTGDPDVERRFSGIRVAALSDDRRLTLEAYDNWGGSGVFSSLITGKMTSDGDALEDIRVHAFGDRCNGGLSGTSIGADGQVIAAQNMTPWDIMVAPFAGLSFEAQWAAAQERYGAALGNAASCAACCSSVTHEYEVRSDGPIASIGLRYRPREAASSADSLSECLEKAVGTASGDDDLVAADELAALAALIDGCAKETFD